MLPKIPEWRLARPQVSFEHHGKVQKKEMPPFEIKSIVLDSIGNSWNGILHVYTDGSKLEDGRTGAAFYCVSLQCGDFFLDYPMSVL